MNNGKLALIIIRMAAAANMLIHGIARIVNNGVTPFDGFLANFGLPPYSAWAITLFEIVGAILLMLNRWVMPIGILFILQLLMGIILVHSREGWFVVGAGRNGVEYSVLLIICFISTLLGARKKT
ncbi:MAG: DoxX family protein [Cyclobacteriaceae bacterium]|nr:DoxX family protein [Cyclobacteriaceae bacterium]